MRPLYVAVLLSLGTKGVAQPYAIGTRNITFFDPDRDRNIGTVIHYPGVTSGNDAVVATGSFPVLVFGHGFLMGVGSYNNLRDHFVPRGYILVLPTTEGGLPPNHGAFGADLAFLAGAMQSAGADAGSPFSGHVAPATALMGHSMGGGASVLGAANNTNIQALVNFAAAETSPSAIAAAADVAVPTLIFAATEDCVTPIAAHQGPIYDALVVECKAFVNIIGGGHCYFANSDFTCELGEFTCFPDLGINRAQHHSVMNDLGGLWLDHFLKNDQAAYFAFMDSLAFSTRVIGSSTCLSTEVEDPRTADDLLLYPVPATDHVRVSANSAITTVQLFDVQGRVIKEMRGTGTDMVVHTGDITSGTYRMLVQTGGRTLMRHFVVIH